MDPMTWANQQFGLLTCNANGGHMLRALEHMRREPLRVEPDAADTVYEVNSIDVYGTPGYQRLMGERTAPQDSSR